MDDLQMSIDQLIFIGLNGYALALDRDTGEIVWSNDQMKSGYVTLLLDGDRLIVSTNGYMYCLDPLTGTILWHNPLRGYRVGPTSIVSVRGQSSQTLIEHAAQNTSQRSSSGSGHMGHSGTHFAP
jgi:outer membrane protein assembly factor BamB